MRLILASASPQRRQLLANIAIVPDEIISTEIDETPRAKELARAYVRRIARDKALAARDILRKSDEDALILAADTMISVGRRLLEKPQDEQQARAYMELLAGRRHRAVTAIAVLRISDGKLVQKIAETRLRMRRLSQREIDIFVASGQWRHRSGGYALQEMASAFIPWINGCWSTVVGLPLSITLNTLTGLGFVWQDK